MTQALALSAVVEAALAGAVVSPEVIGVNFTADTHTLPERACGGAVWNNVVGAAGTDVPLRNASGQPTSARLTFRSGGVYAEFGAPATPNRAVNCLYRGGLVGDDTRSEIHLVVSGIPYPAYDVFVFASADTSNRSTLSITNGHVTFYFRSAGKGNTDARCLLRTQSTDATAPTAGPAQYQVFPGLTGANFVLTTGGSRNCVLSNNVFGLLIVRAGSATATKEPTQALPEHTPRPTGRAATGGAGPRSEIHMPFPQGAIVRVRYQAGGGGSLNICSGADIALHVNPRPKSGALVLNSFIQSAWGHEERPDGYPLAAGEEVHLAVWAGPNGYFIQAGTAGGGGPFFYRYEYRLESAHTPERLAIDLEGLRAVTVQPQL